jgi:uncharacterized membrane protein
MDGLASLVTACALFVGSHFLMSHPARARLVSVFGAQGFLGVYSLVSLALFGWMLWVYMQAPAGNMLWLPTDGIWIAASVLTLLASVLFVGSFLGNPAMPQPGADALATKEPAGVFVVTRHPMMWCFALWAFAHALVAPRAEVFVFMGSFAFLALVGAAGQDRKKAVLQGENWQLWASRTSYWPRFSQLPKVGIRLWLAGIAFWLIASWVHGWLSLPPAGIYRWL